MNNFIKLDRKVLDTDLDRVADMGRDEMVRQGKYVPGTDDDPTDADALAFVCQSLTSAVVERLFNYEVREEQKVAADRVTRLGE